MVVQAMNNTNGNAACIFYSAGVFEKMQISVKLGVTSILFFYLLGSLPAFFLLRKFGRRTIEVYGAAAINVLLFIMGTCVIFKWTKALIVAIAVFMFICNSTVLSTAWIYLHEVGNSKVAAAGTTLNWTVLLIVGSVTKPLFEHK